MFDSDVGRHMYELACKLFPYNRSITGNGVRKTLKEIKKILSDLTIFEVESGSKVFDWEIPDEWIVRMHILLLRVEKRSVISK